MDLKRRKTTLVVVTHNVERARVGDNLVVLHQAHHHARHGQQLDQVTRRKLCQFMVQRRMALHRKVNRGKFQPGEFTLVAGEELSIASKDKTAMVLLLSEGEPFGFFLIETAECCFLKRRLLRGILLRSRARRRAKVREEQERLLEPRSAAAGM
jgi:ABC-type sugar transport system ATPase subunit